MSSSPPPAVPDALVTIGDVVSPLWTGVILVAANPRGACRRRDEVPDARARPFLTSEPAHVPFRAALRGLSGRHASLSHPHLRRLTRRRHRQGGAPFRLVPPHSRPRRRIVHRPARPLRHHPSGGRSRLAGLQDG